MKSESTNIKLITDNQLFDITTLSESPNFALSFFGQDIPPIFNATIAAIVAMELRLNYTGLTEI